MVNIDILALTGYNIVIIIIYHVLSLPKQYQEMIIKEALHQMSIVLP